MLNNSIKYDTISHSVLKNTKSYEWVELVALNQKSKTSTAAPTKLNDVQATEQAKIAFITATKELWNLYKKKHPELFKNDWFLPKETPEIEFTNKLQDGKVAWVDVNENKKINVILPEITGIYKSKGVAGVKEIAAHELMHILTYRMVQRMHKDESGVWRTYKGVKAHLDTVLYLYSKNPTPLKTLIHALCEGAAEILSKEITGIDVLGDLYLPARIFNEKLKKIVGADTYKKFAFFNDETAYKTVVQAAFKLYESEKNTYKNKTCADNKLPYKKQKIALTHIYYKTKILKFNPAPLTNEQIDLLHKKYISERELKYHINHVFPCEIGKYNFSFSDNIEILLKAYNTYTDAEIDMAIRRLHSRSHEPKNTKKVDNAYDFQDELLRFFRIKK